MRLKAEDCMSKRKTEQLDLRDKVSSAYITALDKLGQQYGDEILDAVRKENPMKFAELYARLVSLEPNLSGPADINSCNTTEDISRVCLVNIGMREDAITPSAVEAAHEAYTNFLTRLQVIAEGH
jgi:hypothetical protein